MEKEKYLVTVYKEIWCDDPEDEMRYEIGKFETSAVSEKKAINNIRYRFAGYNSQYLPVSVSGHHDDWFTYEAQKI